MLNFNEHSGNNIHIIGPAKFSDIINSTKQNSLLPKGTFPFAFYRSLLRGKKPLEALNCCRMAGPTKGERVACIFVKFLRPNDFSQRIS